MLHETRCVDCAGFSVPPRYDIARTRDLTCASACGPSQGFVGKTPPGFKMPWDQTRPSRPASRQVVARTGNVHEILLDPANPVLATQRAAQPHDFLEQRANRSREVLFHASSSSPSRKMLMWRFPSPACP